MSESVPAELCTSVACAMMSVESLDWVQEQADEIEAITAIYENEWKCISSTPPQYMLSVPVGIDRSRILDIEVTFPHGYPRSCPVHVAIRSDWINVNDRDRIDSIVSDAKRRLKGTCQVYEIIVDVINYFADRHLGEPIDVPMKPADQQLPADERVAERAPSGRESEHQINQERRESSLSNRDRQESPLSSEIFHSEPLVDRKSVFQAHMAKVKSKQEVESVLRELKSCKKIANATHNVYAYRIATDRGTLDDCDDDGESAAGSRMLHLLHILDVTDVLVVVTRWFGGVQLGPDRFRDYNNCCRNILAEHGLIKEKPRSSKKSTTRSKRKP